MKRHTLPSTRRRHLSRRFLLNLRGIDRIQYGSYSELQSGLERLLAQEFPIQPKHDMENQLAQLRGQAVKLVSAARDGLKMGDIAELLGVSVDMAKVIVYLLVGRELRTEGVKRGARYLPLKG